MLNEQIKKNILKDGINTYLELSFNNVELVDFQIDMINSNKDKGLVAVDKSIFNTTTKLKYNITNLISVDEYIKNNVIDKKNIVNILSNIIEIISESNELLLENSNFVLEKQYVFLDKNTDNTKLINVPLVDKHSRNIEQSFNEFALDLVNTIILDGRIKDGSEKFIVKFKDTLKSSSMSLNEALSYLKSQGNISESIADKIKKDNFDMMQSKDTNKVEIKHTTTNVESSTGSVVVPKAPKVKEKNEEQEPEIVEKMKYKTSTVIAAILIQPIFIGIILGLFLLEQVSLAQIGIGAVLILALDGIILKNLLDSKKKIKVRMKAPVKKKKEKTKNSSKVKAEKVVKERKAKKKKLKKNESEKEVAATVAEEQESIEALVREEINIPEVPVISEEETTILGSNDLALGDEETTILGQYAYLEVNNGVNSGREEIYSNEYIVGRTSNLKEWITNKSISREHFKIINENNEYFIKDLGSKNGTKLNDMIVEANKLRPLVDGDVIEIPNLKITFKLS